MKKLIFFIAILFFTVMVIPQVQSQDTLQPPGNVTTLESTTSEPQPGVFAGIDEYFSTFAAFVVAIPLVTEAIKGLTGAVGFGAQLLSWITGILLALAGWFLNIPGIFDSLLWWQVLIVGFAGSVAANSLFDTGIITYILKKLGILKTS